MNDINDMIDGFIKSFMDKTAAKDEAGVETRGAAETAGVLNRPGIKRLVVDYVNKAGNIVSFEIKPKNFESARQLLALSRGEQVDLVLGFTAMLCGPHSVIVKPYGAFTVDYKWSIFYALQALLSSMLRKKLPFDEKKLCVIIQLLADDISEDLQGEFSYGPYIKQVEEFAGGGALPGELSQKLEALLRTLKKEKYGDMSVIRKNINRIEAILGGGSEVSKGIDLNTGEIWTASLQARLEDLDAPGREKWYALLAVCRKATSSKPSGKWLKQVSALIEDIGADSFVSLLLAVLPEIGKPGAVEKRELEYYTQESEPTQVHSVHSDLLRGLVWCTSLVENEALVQLVGSTADVCFKKIRDVGPRAPKIGNACLYALANSGFAGVAQLSRLESRVKHASSRKQTASALNMAAANAGMTKGELEEIAVPTLELTGIGELRRQLGDHYALLTIADTHKVSLRWFKPGGQEQKSAPAALKESFGPEIKALKNTAKEIEKLLPAQRFRIERLFLEARTWTFGDFRKRYLDHPLVGWPARRLIWRFRDRENEADGIWHDGVMKDARDNTLDWLTDETEVELWHPLTRTGEEVLAWRNWLDRRQVQQPFKQAHREIYILTEAERETGTYSNRFAAHILRQHQFSALCQQRGWHYTLQGAWDSHNVPFIEFPSWGFRVEFWVDAAGGGDGEISGSGIFLHVATDQVRFYSLNEDRQLPLADVPRLFFSELMRDVDLFVGVCSVGNDPNWFEGGPGGGHLDYWRNYSFGDLSESAKTRKEVLERLAPRLKIADRCSFIDKFLVVRGEMRTYKIHLGSGNVLMSPNDQYLCIVPGRGAGSKGLGRVLLPFEGDNTLSIILSKAFLLAEDTKIKDTTITRQISPPPGGQA
jgi:hypothetical protein